MCFNPKQMDLETQNCAAGCSNSSLTDTVKIIYVCPNRHIMHAECVNKLYETADSPTCPICRDDSLSILKDMIIKNPVVKSDDASNIDESDDSDDSDDFVDDDSKTHVLGTVIENSGGIINYYINTV